MKGKWRIFWDPENPDFDENLRKARIISQELKISEFLAKMLLSKGIKTSEEAKMLLFIDDSHTFDPFLLKDMDKLVKLLLEIKEKDEQLVIYGDYDVDGVTAASVLYLGLKALGWKVKAYIPRRIDEGYSLNENAIEELYSQGFKNIITVDCGTTSIKEVEYAKNLGMKIMITDHHEPHEKLPEADAHVNPKRKDDNYPFKGLAGVGVAYKVIQAIVKELNSNYDHKSLLDLVALGTIADIVPLISENRYFVKFGLEKIRKSPREGLKAILNKMHLSPESVKSHTIAYRIAPKINAAGRMNDAMIAFEVLTSEDINRIVDKVEKLFELNQERQKEERNIYISTLSLLDSNPDFYTNRVLILEGKNWHLGVLGIVASKLSGQLNKPVLLISIDGNEGKGSGRSPQGINLIELFTTTEGKNKKIFKEYGGHELAVGFTIKKENVEELKRLMEESYLEIYGLSEYEKEIEINMEIEKLWNGFFEDLEKLEPFGYQNPEPVFLIRDVRVENLRFFGLNSENFAGIMKLPDGSKMEVVGFGLGSELDELRFPYTSYVDCDIIGNIRLEENGKVKFYAKDIKLLHETEIEKRLKTTKLYISTAFKEYNTRLLNKSKLQQFYDLKKVAMFLPLKLKNSVLVDLIIKNMEKNKNIVIISGSHILLSYNYRIVKTYLESSDIAYNSKAKLYPTILEKKRILFLTVPAFYDNYRKVLAFADLIIIDEPMFSVFHPAISGMKDYIFVREIMKSSKSKQIISLGTFLSDEIKEFLKHSGFTVVKIPWHLEGFEIVDERNLKDKEILYREYINIGQTKVILHRNDDFLMKELEFLQKKMKVSSESMLLYRANSEIIEKSKIREKFRKGTYKILATTFVNDGIALETYKTDTLVFLDIPKSIIEFIDAISYYSNKKPKVVLVMAYGRNTEDLIKEYRRFYPSFAHLKKAYDYILSNPGTSLTDISEKVFDGDDGITSVVVDELINSEICIENGEGIECVDKFDISLLHESVRIRESVLDQRILKSTMKMFLDLDTKVLINVLGKDHNQILRFKII